MENKFLIDISVKYGLTDKQVSKVVDILYQLGYYDLNGHELQRAGNYMCSMKLVNLPAEEVLEEMKRKGFNGEEGGAS